MAIVRYRYIFGAKSALYRYDRLNGGLSLQTLRETSVALSPTSKHVDSPQKYDITCSDPQKEHIIWYIQQMPI